MLNVRLYFISGPLEFLISREKDGNQEKEKDKAEEQMWKKKTLSRNERSTERLIWNLIFF